ncbi:MAG: tape measure protein [Treponema sp.]|nr:tape measure protein [Treponema sp.]
MADKKTLELQIQVLMQQAQQQIKSFSAEIKSTADQIKNLNTNNINVKESIKSVQSEAKRAATELNNFSTAGSTSINSLVKEIGNLATVAAAVSFDKWALNLAGGALSASTSFRAAKEDFGIMLGDMQAGAGLFAELQEFNFWTPFDMDTTAQATKVLMAAKVPLQDITEYLTRFGDISQGNSQRFQSFINAFSKASAKGKADMEVLNVYIDQGVQILDALGQQMGVTSAEIVDMASKGKISFQDLNNALASMAEEGGLYYNSMVTASQRLDAMQSGLQESINALAASFGDMLAPMVGKALEILTKLVDAINDSPFLKGTIAAALSAVVVIINTQMIRAIVAFIAKTWAAYASQMALTSALSLTNPLLLAGVTAVAAATAGYVVYASTQQEAAKATEELALAQKKLNEVNKNSAFDDFLSNSTLEEMKTAIEKGTQQLNLEKKALEELQKKLNTGTFLPSDLKFSVNVEASGVSQLEEKIKDSQAKIKELEEKLSKAQIRLTELQTGALNQELEDANKILERRDALYKNTTESQREKIKEDLEFAKSLYTLQTLNPNGTYSGFDKSKTEAIIKNLQEQLNKLQPTLGNEWQVKLLKGKDKVLYEWNQAIEELNKKGKNVFGEDFVNESAFQAEMDALNEYFQKKVDEIKETEIDIKFNFQTLKDMALSSAGSTEVGQVANGFSQGGLAGGVLAVLNAFISAVVNAIAELENGQKVLNFITTIVENIFKEIGDLVNDALGPTVRLLETFGTVIGKILKPIAYFAEKFAENETFIRTITVILEQLCIVLDALFTILQPILDILSEVLKWFGYVVNPLGGLVDGLGLYSEKTTEAAEELEKQTEMIRKKYERQAQAVEDLLQSQLDSLRSQYELGLITREQYESQAEKYAADADSKIYDINKQMEEHLENIEKNTEAALTPEQKATIKPSGITGLMDGLLSPITGISDDIKEGDWWGAATGLVLPGGGAIKDDIAEGNWWAAAGDLLTGGLGSAFGWWDVGSYNIPEDQFGMVHKGEIIVPRTFAEGIRSGELTLGSNRTSNNAINVNVVVQGSVTTEKELVSSIYNGIAAGIQTREFQPLLGA